MYAGLYIAGQDIQFRPHSCGAKGRSAPRTATPSPHYHCVATLGRSFAIAGGMSAASPQQALPEKRKGNAVLPFAGAGSSARVPAPAPRSGCCWTKLSGGVDSQVLEQERYQELERKEVNRKKNLADKSAATEPSAADLVVLEQLGEWPSRRASSRQRCGTR